MIKYLTELVKELNKQGYSWVLPIEVERGFVRVRDGKFGEDTYYISWNVEGFEISLTIEKEDGSLAELPPVKRETIAQVVDYIME